MRCAVWALDNEVEFGGTGGSQAGYLLVEWPMPWPRDVADVGALGGLVEELAPASIRLQLVKAETHPSVHLRVVLYRRDLTEGFAGYRRREIVVEGDLEELPAQAKQLLDSWDNTDPHALSTATLPTDPKDPLDVLVCTHGTRDVCCGSQGTALVRALMTSPAVVGSGVRVWRTSHLGGHRFAPTALTLPDGVVWGRLTEQAMEAIICRDGPAAALSHLVRGCSGLGSPEAQLLDRALFAEHGWMWLDERRHDTCRSDGRVAIRIDESTGVGPRAWDAQIVRGRDMPVPICRRDLTGSAKRERELILGAYRRVHP